MVWCEIGASIDLGPREAELCAEALIKALSVFSLGAISIWSAFDTTVDDVGELTEVEVVLSRDTVHAWLAILSSGPEPECRFEGGGVVIEDSIGVFEVFHSEGSIVVVVRYLKRASAIVGFAWNSWVA